MAILAAQRKTGRIAMTAFKKRFAPAYQKARKIIASGDFGAPALLTVLRTKGYSPQNDSGQADYLLPWGCHAIDLVTYLFGNVAQVSALQSAGTTHAYAVNLCYANGALGQLAVTDRAGPVWEEATAIGGNMMTVRVQNSIQMTAYKGDQPCAAHSPEFSCGSKQGAVEQGFVGELQEFADAIAEGREPESNIVQATHSMAVYEAIKRSAQSGSIVNVEDL
jgi:predicted dehydrogenase